MIAGAECLDDGAGLDFAGVLTSLHQTLERTGNALEVVDLVVDSLQRGSGHLRTLPCRSSADV
jgi:hypothetical protein